LLGAFFTSKVLQRLCQLTFSFELPNHGQSENCRGPWVKMFLRHWVHVFTTGQYCSILVPIL